MSLLRLLTAGKSLVGLKNPESRYRLPGQRTLPKFGSKKNPFRATALPEKADPAETRRALATEEQIPSPPAAGAQEVKAEEPPMKPAVRGGAEADVPGAEPRIENRAAKEQPKVLEPTAPCPSGLKALLLWGRAKKGKPFGARTSRPLVQGELSLDKVKVVRNDLSETDLEVVRVDRAAAAVAPGPLKNTVPGVREAEPAWSAAAGRLFGLGKS